MVVEVVLLGVQFAIHLLGRKSIMCAVGLQHALPARASFNLIYPVIFLLGVSCVITAIFHVRIQKLCKALTWVIEPNGLLHIKIR